MDIEKVAVIGSGTMGCGIAHVFALNGYLTQLVDIKTEYLEKSFEIISKNLSRQVKKEIITEDQKMSAISNITPVVGIGKIDRKSDLIVEAVSEKKKLKLNIFQELDERVSGNTIFASNTSSISITELAAGVSRPDKVIGMHFMNPVPLMQLVEIIRGYSTSEETYNIIKSTTENLDKTPVEVHDYPGFVSNRILMPMINEAIYCVFEGVASVEDIDSVMKLGMNHPMGPLALADFIGLDVCLAIMEVLYDGFNDTKYRPCPLLKKMVIAGKLGRKSNEGFYQYD